MLACVSWGHSQVFSELRKMKKHLLNVPDDEEWLIQKYIERPLYVDLLWCSAHTWLGVAV